MKFPELFDVIDIYLLTEWRKEIEKSDKYGYLRQQSEEKEKLYAHLDAQSKKIANDFELAVVNSLDYIYFEICKNLFVYALKAGMELQKTIDNASE